MSSIIHINNALKYAIMRAVAECGQSKNFSRKSTLSRDTIIRLLIGAEGGSLDKILHTAGIKVTASAVSQRRAQIDPAVFRAVFDKFNSDCTDSELLNGYRLFAVDGTTINLPRNPSSPSFVQHDGIPKGVNQLHVIPLYDILNRTFADTVIQPEPRKDEIGALVEMLKRNTFQQTTLIIADRGFEIYNLIAHCIEKKNVDFLTRVKQNHSAMREVAKLPMMEVDCNIGFTITTTQTNEDKERHYIHLQVPKKSKAGSKTKRGRWDFPSPYPMRFRICREVVIQQPKEGMYAYKVNFKIAVMLCKKFLRTPNADEEKLLREIARYTVPIRPERQDERNLKVKGFAGFVYRVAA